MAEENDGTTPLSPMRQTVASQPLCKMPGEKTTS
jgi:hypothetical protein